MRRRLARCARRVIAARRRTRDEPHCLAPGAGVTTRSTSSSARRPFPEREAALRDREEAIVDGDDEAEQPGRVGARRPGSSPVFPVAAIRPSISTTR
jgi:hypothetical protein